MNHKDFAQKLNAYTILCVEDDVEALEKCWSEIEDESFLLLAKEVELLEESIWKNENP
jgi:predicted RNA methylase